MHFASLRYLIFVLKRFYIFQSNLLRFTLSSTKVWCWNLTSKRREKNPCHHLADWNIATCRHRSEIYLTSLEKRHNIIFDMSVWAGKVHDAILMMWIRVFVHKDVIFNTQGTNNAKSGRIFKFHGGFYKLYLFHVWVPHSNCLIRLWFSEMSKILKSQEHVSLVCKSILANFKFHLKIRSQIIQLSLDVSSA